MPETFFGWVFFILDKYGSLFLKGTLNTLLVAVVGTVCGFMLGLFVAILRSIALSPKAGAPKRFLLRVLKGLLSVYIEVFRGTPMIVQAMVLYYGALQYLHLNMNEMAAALLVISINTGAYMAEIIRGGILSVDVGQREAAHSIGMTHWQTMALVILPQAVRNILPSIGNEFVVNIKDSSVLNVISMTELYFMSKSAAGTYLRYFEVFFITGVIYLFLTFTITRLLRMLEHRLEGPDHFTIHGSQSDSRSAIPIHEKEDEHD